VKNEAWNEEVPICALRFFGLNSRLSSSKVLKGAENPERSSHTPMLLRGKVLKTLGLLKDGFLYPVQGKPIKKGRVPPIAPDFEEDLFEPLI